jgi:hypothetical protein
MLSSFQVNGGQGAAIELHVLYGFSDKVFQAQKLSFDAV